LRKNSKHYFCI